MKHSRLVLFVSTALALTVPAYAADKGNSITVIGDDGKAQTIEMDDADMALPGPEQFDVPAASTQREDEQFEEKPVPAAPPPKPVPEAIVKPGRYVDPIIAPANEPQAQPAPAPVAKKEAPVKKPKADKPAEKKKADKKTDKKSKGKKSKKSSPPPKTTTQEEVTRNIPPGQALTQREAELIAMDSAPPSSGFTTVMQSYKGKDAYVVTFKTDDGPYDVLIDALTGDVLVSAYVENEPGSTPTAPGHLPDSWEPFTPQPVGTPEKK
jgi:outer membrane biosynthesis protein TonB